MVTEELDREIEKAKINGQCPIMVNATAGTTVLGAIDRSLGESFVPQWTMDMTILLIYNYYTLLIIQVTSESYNSRQQLERLPRGRFIFYKDNFVNKIHHGVVVQVICWHIQLLLKI